MRRAKSMVRRIAIVSGTTLGMMALLFTFWWLLVPLVLRTLLAGSTGDWGPGP
ncbi:hypothetical protein [Streptacidiphilus jiangxiensis]|uniref:Uncharacterized protein n=1 Tax=Streptacidiphilus jiangxiensis TaxID=235985 RepID=A0A1H7MR67_STRJI|nr:hypothetical protein [Streptacidiphilus jiangxiensis]SEL13684.1 hypothetical protein SAMN05414137_10619 [Streptacidiphilus jiangxiensis]